MISFFPAKRSGRPAGYLKNPGLRSARQRTSTVCACMICDIALPAPAPAEAWGSPIIGKLLGHSTPAMTARYSHFDGDPMHRAVNKIGAELSAAMSKTPGAGVVTLKRG